MRKPCVLVIEDDARYRDIHDLNFAPAGYSVLFAADGGRALDLLARNQIDAVILDLMLPGTDGYDLCHRIRRQWPIPIIVVSALAEESHKVRGLRTGADDYVTKPFDPQELIARVEAVRRRR